MHRCGGVGRLGGLLLLLSTLLLACINICRWQNAVLHNKRPRPAFNRSHLGLFDRIMYQQRLGVCDLWSTRRWLEIDRRNLRAWRGVVIKEALDACHLWLSRRVNDGRA